MDETPYSFSADQINARYTFESISETKTVKKIVQFTATDLPMVFSMALLDQLDDGQESDLNVTNNDDLTTVLATVMQIIHNFLTKFPARLVTFTGSDARRIRLYRIVISHELKAIQEWYRVYGLINDRFEEFRPDSDYMRFFIGLKD